eukprot:29120-Pelagococcus_subviridis.AAC.8
MRSPTSRIAGVDATGCSAADGVAVDGVAAAARASVTAAAAGVPSTDARFFARARSADDADDGGRDGVDDGCCSCFCFAAFPMGDFPACAAAAPDAKHARQDALYPKSLPPMSSTSSVATAPARAVNAASPPQPWHTALSFVTSSAIGTRPRTAPNGVRLKSPSSAATMTVFPSLAHFSQNATTSGKNCPSSTPMTSNECATLSTSASRCVGYATNACRSCVIMHPRKSSTPSVPASAVPGSDSYRVSFAYFTTRHERFATLCRRIRRASSVDFPENIGPVVMAGVGTRGDRSGADGDAGTSDSDARGEGLVAKLGIRDSYSAGRETHRR